MMKVWIRFGPRWLALLMGLSVVPLAGHAQDPAQEQMRRMQVQMEQMNRQMERMEHIREQAHRLEMNMVQEMERLQRLNVADRSRLLEHERLRDMSREMARMAEALRGATERMRDVVRDRQMSHTAEMQQEMERLRIHMEEMCDRMEEGLGIMERLRLQLRVP